MVKRENEPAPLKEAMVERHYYESSQQPRQHLGDFLAAYNFAKRLKTLRRLTHMNTSAKSGRKTLTEFRMDPAHNIAGLYT